MKNHVAVYNLTHLGPWTWIYGKVKVNRSSTHMKIQIDQNTGEHMLVYKYTNMVDISINSTSIIFFLFLKYQYLSKQQNTIRS